MVAKKNEVVPVDAEIVAEVVQATGVIVPREGDFISQYLRIEQDNDELPDGAGYQAIMDQIMSATSMDDLFSENSADKPSDVYRRKLTVFGYSVLDSDFEVGPPVYFAIQVHDEVDDKPRVIVTGNQAVMAQCMKAKQMGWFPAKLMFIQGERPNRFGGYPIRLITWKD